MKNVSAIILAAGKGTRMQSTDTNKVALNVSGEPMLSRTLRILRESGISQFIVVVGFAKESVLSLLPKDVIVAEQTEQLGTGHAVLCALEKVPMATQDVLIVYGDDSFLHTPATFQSLYNTHEQTDAKITFITMDAPDPTGFGRIIRDSKGEIVGIVEEKNATEKERQIREINLGCYIIDRAYLEENIKNISKNPVTGEYYITDIIDIISSHHGKISAYKLTDQKWQGVNTREDLTEAEKLVAYGS